MQLVCYYAHTLCSWGWYARSPHERTISLETKSSLLLFSENSDVLWIIVFMLDKFIWCNVLQKKLADLYFSFLNNLCVFCAPLFTKILIISTFTFKHLTCLFRMERIKKIRYTQVYQPLEVEYNIYIMINFINLNYSIWSK